MPLKELFPVVEELSVAQGVLGFAPDPSGHAGPFTTVTTKTGERLMFSCEGGRKADRDCLRRDQQATWQGRPARVWWFTSTTSTGSKWRSLAQLEIDGKVIRSFSTSKADYEAPNSVFVTALTLLVLGTLAYLIVVPLRTK